MYSPENFSVNKIVAVSFGSDGKHKPYLIVEDPLGKRVLIPAETLDQSVGEIDAATNNKRGETVPGSTLQVLANETYEIAIKVSQNSNRSPQIKSPVS